MKGQTNRRLDRDPFSKIFAGETVGGVDEPGQRGGNCPAIKYKGKNHKVK
jgi:hypothetical protein